MSDGIALIRTLGALLTVLGVLAGALWAVRRYNLVLPGTAFARADKRLAVVERLSLDPRRSLALLRRDGVEHLVLLAPEGHLVIESSIVGAAPAIIAPPVSASSASAFQMPVGSAASVASIGGSFDALVERTLRVKASPPESMPPAHPATTSGIHARSHA